MNQAKPEPSTPQSAHADRTGFDIGWDHAHHGLVPPANCLHPDNPVMQGWTAAKAVFGRRVMPSRRSTRQWLLLRLRAWQEGVPFDGQLVTANYLGQLFSERCPVTRCLLGGAAGNADAAVIERINPEAAYAAGNLVMLSASAAAARRGLTMQQTVRKARLCELSGEVVDGLDASSWWRLATLAAFAQALPFAEAARLPLALLPPNRVRLLNAVQGLQALVTQIFANAGWSRRCQSLAQWLPEHTLRLDFNLFVGAMAPRVLEAAADPVARRTALEDAWLQERVQRRWQHLVLSLGEAGVQALLGKLLQSELPRGRVVQYSPAQATETWGWPPTKGTHAAAPARDRVLKRVSTRVMTPTRPPGRPGTVPAPAAPATHV